MKKLLIIYPNWIPSNAVGVQRVRLIVNFLEDFGWVPIIITVSSEYYEEEISWDLKNLVRLGLKVEYVKAEKQRKLFRIYGDIALRAFFNLRKRATEIVKSEKIDYIWAPIPPFYTALIANQVHKATGVPYGIDYIDPWVHEFPGSEKIFSRAKLASKLARFLEPFAVKEASFFRSIRSLFFTCSKA